ncbi:MAG: hypothetical protein MJ007_01915 [Paludibacteraceae bacterium]|nr:hypothetical protein [Paludibacteraceae bacterium]
MFKWSVITQTQNIEGGVAITATQKDTKKGAEDLYYDTLSKTGGNPATKYLRVELKNEKGELQLASVRDNSQYLEE